VGVLRANDLGGRTKPAPRLYPHQWSWDSAFIAIGLAHIDPARALGELESLLAAQWADGRVPHIVFDPAAHGYSPGPDRWACATLADAAPRAPATSGLVQPPVHALAAWHIVRANPHQAAVRTRLAALYPRLLAWHRYLATARDPDGSGLVTIYHPWESGTDNSPRWDAPLANVEVGVVPPYERHDLQHVADPSERPTRAEYDRYLWLVESLKAARYDDATIHRAHPFLVKDALFSAIFAAANEALGRLAEAAGAPEAQRAEIARWARRAGAAVQRHVDARERLALDLDLRTGAPIRVRTCAGLAPLLVPGLERRVAGGLVHQLTGTSFAGAPAFAFPVVPSAAPGSPGFRSRAYWRGPSWPVVNWLLWWGLRRQEYAEQASELRAANLALLARPEARFGEYFEPYTGEQLGSPGQSWTAAVTLDWLAHGESWDGRPAARSASARLLSPGC
jgi:hypothetical protein